MASGAGGATAARPNERWSLPFPLAGYAPRDLLGPQVGVDSRGNAVVAFTRDQPERPELAEALAVARTATGATSRQLSLGGGSRGGEQALAAAGTGSRLAVLTGRAAAGARCCSAVQVRGIAPGGGMGAPRTIFSSVLGETSGSLVGLRGRLLAAVASLDGVWVSQQGPDGFAAARRLSPEGQLVDNLASAGAPDGHSVIAWTVADPNQLTAAPPVIELATGDAYHAPGKARLAAALPAGRGVEELAVAMDGQPLVGWIEGWVDGEGVAHTSIRLLSPSGRIRSYSVPGELLSGFSLDGDGHGLDVAAFRGCTRSGACEVRAAIKRARGRFGPARSLGLADAGSTPALSVRSDGSAVVTWVSGGEVEAALLPRRAHAFGRPVRIVAGGDATSVALASGGKLTLAAVVRGTELPRLDGVALVPVPAPSAPARPVPRPRRAAPGR